MVRAAFVRKQHDGSWSLVVVNRAQTPRQLRAALPADDGLWDAEAGGPRDLAALRAELDAASAEHQQLVRDCETHRQVAEEATKLLSERELRAARAKEKLDAAQAELTLAMQRLAAQRALTNGCRARLCRPSLD